MSKKGIKTETKSIIYSNAGRVLDPTSDNKNNNFILHGNIIEVNENIESYNGIIGDNIPDELKDSVEYTAMSVFDLVEKLNVDTNEIVDILLARMERLSKKEQTDISNIINNVIGNHSSGFEHDSSYDWKRRNEFVITANGTITNDINLFNQNHHLFSGTRTGDPVISGLGNTSCILSNSLGVVKLSSVADVIKHTTGVDAKHQSVSDVINEYRKNNEESKHS